MGQPWGNAFDMNGLWMAADFYSHCVYTCTYFMIRIN